MPAWELGDISLQFRAFGSSDPWQDDPASLTAPSNGKLDVRFAFYVVNGTGPITTGDIKLEGNVDGAGYVDWVGTSGKLLEPGYSVFPVVYPPDWWTGSIDFTGYGGSVILFRARLTWTTPGYSDVSTVTVSLKSRGPVEAVLLESSAVAIGGSPEAAPASADATMIATDGGPVQAVAADAGPLATPYGDSQVSASDPAGDRQAVDDDGAASATVPAAVSIPTDADGVAVATYAETTATVDDLKRE